MKTLPKNHSHKFKLIVYEDFQKGDVLTFDPYNKKCKAVIVLSRKNNSWFHKLIRKLSKGKFFKLSYEYIIRSYEKNM